VDIFQRVLVVAPDDFVSHVGMSIIADDKGRLDDAIWHMERAFEVQPANAAIQAELQRLFGRRDGIEPPKIRLTRGALAHMYVQGELFPQAISEIRAVLSTDAKRTDMQTLLARAYYRNGQKAEAAEICTELLSKYPYCLDANRLMAEIAPGTQRADMAQEYRKRVIDLDPYAAFVQDSLFRADSVADGLVTIERLDYTGVTAETPLQLGIGLEPEAAPTTRTPAAGTAPSAATSANLPSWLQGTADEAAAAAPAVPPAPSQEDIPDFLRKAGWGAASEAPTEQPPAVPAQPESGEETGGAVEGELPDWVKALAPKEEPAAPIGATTPPTAESAAEPELPSSETFAADTPDWLRDLGPAPAEPTAVVPPAPASADVPTLPPDAPDWLRELGPAPAQPAASSPEPVAASSEEPTPCRCGPCPGAATGRDP
jgi:Tfp pilus assembly protein PilF